MQSKLSRSKAMEIKDEKAQTRERRQMDPENLSEQVTAFSRPTPTML